MAHLTFSDDELVTLLNDPYIFQNDSLIYFKNPFNLFESDNPLHFRWDPIICLMPLKIVFCYQSIHV